MFAGVSLTALGFIGIILGTQSARTNYDCWSVTAEILKKIHGENLAGQILASDRWFDFILKKCESSKRAWDRTTYSSIFTHQRIPWLVYGLLDRQDLNFSTTTASIPIRFSSKKFVHIDHSLSTIGSSPAITIASMSTKHHLYLSFKLAIRNLWRDKDKSATINSLLKWDFFITFFSLPLIPLQNRTSLVTAANRRTHFIRVWVGLIDGEERSGQFPIENDTEMVHRNHSSFRITCLFSSHRSCHFLKDVENCRGKIAHVNQAFRGSLECKGNLYKLNVTEFPEKDLPDSNKKTIPYRFRKNSFLYGSLVFIARRPLENNSTIVLGPFSVASWIGILAAYTITAIAFGVIKIVTMNNLDSSWYECILNQFWSFVKEEKALVPENNISTVDNGNMVDENENIKMFEDKPQQETLDLRRISVRSVAISVPDHSTKFKSSNNSSEFGIHETHHRGKMSKAILYGTIRVVSFVLLAMYEGKLYNTITFPKSKLMASFDELISNDKYFIKVSNEAAKYDNISERIRERDEVISGSKYSRHVVLTSENRSSKVIESVNIMDCVNWVESGPDKNHACVGYEFELRNIHKAQKSDKILVKSKQKLLKLGSSSSVQRLSRRRGFTLYPGGFQISKWILESGILQLWSMVENAFMESLINPNWSDPFKVFTIRDYLGLFVVYSLLLILASIMFLLEHTITYGKKILKNKSYSSVWKYICKCSKRCSMEMPCHEKMKYFKWRERKYFRSSRSINHIVV